MPPQHRGMWQPSGFAQSNRPGARWLRDQVQSTRQNQKCSTSSIEAATPTERLLFGTHAPLGYATLFFRRIKSRVEKAAGARGGGGGRGSGHRPVRVSWHFHASPPPLNTLGLPTHVLALLRTISAHAKRIKKNNRLQKGYARLVRAYVTAG